MLCADRQRDKNQQTDREKPTQTARTAISGVIFMYEEPKFHEQKKFMKKNFMKESWHLSSLLV